MKDKIKEILYNACDDDRVYEDGIDLLEDVIDSMALIEFISALEDEFDIEISPTEIPLDNLRTIDGITEFVEGKISENE
ncbi:MAG: acyl carrier protein [Clostridia bacterium]|nr:acyl carrier protein [Clostridia bacterium]